MAEHSIIAVYDTMAKAEEAVYALDRGGLPLKQVSIVAQDLQSEKVVHGYVTVENMAQKGVITGAWAGGLLGLLTGVAFMWMPGFGPLIVAGRLTSVLLGLLGGIEGVVAGMAWGGVFGTLMGAAVSGEHIEKYEEHVKPGKYLVVVHGSDVEEECADNTLQDTEAIERQIHAEASS